MKVRKNHIEACVLEIYQHMSHVSFPIDPISIIKSCPNCKILTYQQIMESSQCDLQEIIELCQSSEGCTHYDIAQDKYLILWNDDDMIVDGRKRWTQAHELGHVVLKHLLLIAHKLTNQSNLSESEYETEADYFAAMLLCPTPACEVLHISSPSEIQKQFGLSRTAALNRWKDYQRGGQHHHKTAWHDDLERVILQKIDA
jgi:Zn-dependent peptidase ImmA (M78 family)